MLKYKHALSTKKRSNNKPSEAHYTTEGNLSLAIVGLGRIPSLCRENISTHGKYRCLLTLFSFASGV